MASSIITPAHVEEKGKEIVACYPPAQCLILRHLSAMRVVRDAKYLSRVCRLEGCARHAALATTLHLVATLALATPAVARGCRCRGTGMLTARFLGDKSRAGRFLSCFWAHF